jgi:hypothetical protein
MRNIEVLMNIVYTENNQTRWASHQKSSEITTHILNDAVNGKIDTLFKLLPSAEQWIARTLTVDTYLNNYKILFLYKNLKIKIYKTIILPVVLYGCETWSLTLKGRMQAKGIWKRDSEANIWAQEGWELGVEKAPQWGNS